MNLWVYTGYTRYTAREWVKGNKLRTIEACVGIDLPLREENNVRITQHLDSFKYFLNRITGLAVARHAFIKRHLKIGRS